MIYKNGKYNHRFCEVQHKNGENKNKEGGFESIIVKQREIDTFIDYKSQKSFG